MKPQITESRFKGIYQFKNYFCTKNDVKKQSVYGERLIFDKGQEYRLWDPTRSKLGAALKRGVSQIGIKPQTTVLYLGCSTGTTVSHVSEIIGKDSKVYALDVAPRVLRDLIFLSEKRQNIIPIMADAAHPGTFMHIVPIVDTVFMDIAQKNQVEIFLKNVEVFVKDGGFGVLSVKARSIDVTKKPKDIFMQTRQELEKHVTIVDYRTLDPYEADHALFVCKKKK